MLERHRIRQALAVARMEVAKTLLTARALPLYMLAALPIGLITLFLGLRMIDPALGSELSSPGNIAAVYALVFQFLLRTVLFGGAVWIFINLFRGEILDRSLHYYFLAPLRREVLVAGKFLAGWVSGTLLFGGSAMVSLFLLHTPLGISRALGHLLAGAGLGQLLAYLCVVALACLGYGAIFCAAGLIFRNPILPAVIIWLWEAANPFLPALLKKLSVIFYLSSLLPVPLDSGPFAVLADPVPGWLAVPGLIAFTVLLLSFASWRVRKMEIAYAE